MWRSNNHELHSIIFYAYAFSTGDDCCFDSSRRHAVNFTKRNHNLIATTSVVGLNLAALYILLELFGGKFVPANVMGMFMVDPFTLFYQFMILVASLACCTLSHAYIETYKDNREELYLLLLASVAGAMLMVASSHYASFFISLELMSIPVYGLLAYTYQRSQSLEAGIKYLVLSATASAMLLMGMAYIYATLVHFHSMILYKLYLAQSNSQWCY